MEPVAPAAAARPYRDRYVGLVCFGVLEMLLGLLALLGLMSVLLVAATQSTLPAATPPGASARALLPGASGYLVAAVFFFWLGIGSILARRWARALMLIAAWFWLAVGLLSLGFLALIYPSIQLAMARGAAGGANGSPADPGAALGIVQGCIFVFLAAFYVVLPLAFLLFYRSPHVKATCEARDPISRWTDRCPLPVLGLGLLEGFLALACLGFTAGYRTMAFFGLIITGLPAIVIGLGFAILFAFMALATYRLAPWAWWSAASLLALGIASVVATAFHPIHWAELYRQMGFDAGQLEQSGVLAMLQDNRMLWFSALSLVPCLAYLLWVRRFFFPPVGGPQGQAPPLQPAG